MSLTLYPLGDYLQLLQRKNLQLDFSGAPLTREVALVSCDSRQVVPGTLFICKGAHFKVEFLQSAKEQGAFVYLAEKKYDQVDLPCILVSDVRLAMAYLADFYYNHPSSKLGVVGITGTKGKSSTAYYLKYIFDEYLAAKGQPASGVISSIETYDGVEKFESHLTTPEPLDLERHFANAVGAGIRYLTMEVSSQALKYDRVKNVEFAAAVFLNIGMDHISPIEHPNFEDYFASKLRIFAQAAAACVNLDCDHADRVLEAARKNCPRIITFSQKDPSATIFGSQVRKAGGDILFRVKTPRYSREFRLTMPGLFNVQNALAALAVCEAMHYALVALHIRIQTAAAYEHLGKREEARVWLGKALSGAAPDGLVMPFVENYAHLKPLLARERKTDLIAKITELGEAAGARNAASAHPAAFDALTPREFEIVELIAQRLSNREIAEKLYLSEGSVKQYVNQIYSKLHMEGDTRTKRKRLAGLFWQKT